MMQGPIIQITIVKRDFVNPLIFICLITKIHDVYVIVKDAKQKSQLAVSIRN